MKEVELRDLIKRVKEKVDILQVIGQRIPLDRNHKALCPFHKETAPSFSVNTKGQYFHCFGCGVGGDVLRFLELYEKKPFLEVLFELAKQEGILLPSMTPEARQGVDEARTLERILSEAAEYYHKSLTPDVKKYLTEDRDFTGETISRFRIGYAKGGLRRHLIDKCKFPLDLCLRAGVLKQTDEGTVKDYFYNRIIFPNMKRGQAVHLSGRSLDGYEPKYLHLPGQIRYLYNEDSLYSKEVFIVEGVTDCISAVQAGYPAVAILGASSFKQEYLPKFSRCEAIYICLDGDKSGEKGSLKSGELIGERARIVQLPEEYDLNDYFKEYSKEDFERLVGSANGIIKYELNRIPADMDKIELPRMLEPILKRLAGMEKVKAEAYLSYEIKPRFKLKNDDINGYRELIRKYRKEETEAPNIQTSNHDTESVYTAHLDGLVDLVEYKGNVAFLIKDGDKLSIQHQINKGGIVYVPPSREQIPWLLPRGEEVLKYYKLQEVLSQKEIDGALYSDLFVYHKEISELPDEKYYDLIVAWDFHTYLLETVQYSPIICFFAVPERGKSRTGKGMIYVAYRGIHVESLRDAYLVRVANNFQASLFFDVKDIWKKAVKNGSEDILLHRFEKGAKVPRVLHPERGAFRDIVYYTIFGPTIISTNEGVHRILGTRAITINMPETSKQFENDVTPELSLPLKERLLAFRARHLGETIGDILKPAAGRLGDILKPLQQIIRLVRPEREASFLRLVKELEVQRLKEKADSIEAQILMVLTELEDKVDRGLLTIKVITNALNEDKSEKFKVGSKKIGRRLSAMGFTKDRLGNDAAIMWDQGKIEQMINSYGLKKTH